MSDWDDVIDDDQDDTDSQTQRPNPMRDIRNQLRKETQARKAAEKQATEYQERLKGYETSERQQAVSTLAANYDLNEKQVALYTKLNPEGDVTEASLEDFITNTLGFEIEYEEGDSPADSESGAFRPTPPVGRSVQGRVLSKDEWLELSLKDKGAAQDALQSGKVDLSEVEALKPPPE